MNKIKFILLIASIFTCFILYNTCENIENIEKNYDIKFEKIIAKNDPPCLQMYFYIKKYAKQYNIPLDYAFGLAYQETGYRGPFHFKYNPKQTSFAEAKGPMQIMLSTARGINKDNVSEYRLLNDIEYNVRTSMKFLRILKDRYGDWGLVMGYYNTGRPCINEYALKIYNKNYIWDK